MKELCKHNNPKGQCGNCRNPFVYNSKNTSSDMNYCYVCEVRHYGWNDNFCSNRPPVGDIKK